MADSRITCVARLRLLESCKGTEELIYSSAFENVHTEGAPAFRRPLLLLITPEVESISLMLRARPYT